MSLISYESATVPSKSIGGEALNPYELTLGQRIVARLMVRHIVTGGHTWDGKRLLATDEPAILHQVAGTVYSVPTSEDEAQTIHILRHDNDEVPYVAPIQPGHQYIGVGDSVLVHTQHEFFPGEA